MLTHYICGKMDRVDLLISLSIGLVVIPALTVFRYTPTAQFVDRLLSSAIYSLDSVLPFDWE